MDRLHHLRADLEAEIDRASRMESLNKRRMEDLEELWSADVRRIRNMEAMLGIKVSQILKDLQLLNQLPNRVKFN